MFNTAVTKLNAPPVSVVLNWKASYDQSQGDLIDMSQAVPGYTAHNDMLAALAEAAANPELARYGPVEATCHLASPTHNILAISIAAQLPPKIFK